MVVYQRSTTENTPRRSLPAMSVPILGYPEPKLAVVRLSCMAHLSDTGLPRASFWRSFLALGLFPYPCALTFGFPLDPRCDGPPRQIMFSADCRLKTVDLPVRRTPKRLPHTFKAEVPLDSSDSRISAQTSSWIRVLVLHI